MKFEVYGRKEKEEEETVYFDLKKGVEDGNIYLHQVNKDGDHISGSNILEITPDGRLGRFGLCEAKGIKINGRGQIKLNTED